MYNVTISGQSADLQIVALQSVYHRIINQLIADHRQFNNEIQISTDATDCRDRETRMQISISHNDDK